MVPVQAASTLRSSAGDLVDTRSIAMTRSGVIGDLYGDWVPWKRVKLMVKRE